MTRVAAFPPLLKVVGEAREIPVVLQPTIGVSVAPEGSTVNCPAALVAALNGYVCEPLLQVAPAPPVAPKLKVHVAVARVFVIRIFCPDAPSVPVEVCTVSKLKVTADIVTDGLLTELPELSTMSADKAGLPE